MKNPQPHGGPRRGPGAELYRRLRTSLWPDAEPDRIDVRRGDQPYERVVEPGPPPAPQDQRTPAPSPGSASDGPR